MIAVVTGGTSGVGRAIAHRLAGQGYDVIVTGRNAERGAQTLRELRSITSRAAFVQGDLSCLDGIELLADAISQRVRRIDLLVHCAGIVDGARRLTADGIDQHFAVNYLARFALQQHLSPLLIRDRAEPPPAILLISGASNGDSIRYREILTARTFGVLSAVRQSCRANDLFALGLRAHGLVGTRQPVRVACLKLGVVKTAIRRTFPWWMKVVVPLLFDPWLGQTPAEAANAAFEVFDRVSTDVAAGPLFTRIRRLREYELRGVTAPLRDWHELEHFSLRLMRRLRPAPSAAVVSGLDGGYGE